jgi:hypothetical protein
MQGTEFDEAEFFRSVVSLPTLDDLILTKRVAARPKDLEDIRLLQALKAEEER